MRHKHTGVTAPGGKRAVLAGPEPPAAGVLAVRRERRANVLILWLSGALDRATSALLDREVEAHTGRIPRLVVDLTGLEFIDSRGLDTLVRTHRHASERGQRLSFRHGPHVGQRPVELTRNVQLRSRAATRRAGRSDDDDDYFALAMACSTARRDQPLPRSESRRASA